ncbi:hypothetical protein [Acidisphaera sp. S103]|uniref:hypothetical protein n=1 Tax=Acidisphaera sp. S103 TaxID=1747223 RepID=UPI00131C4491|nr:hypothetical protein [Acidisphaera sp. S103]
MATTAQAIERFALVTGIPEPHVGRVARILQLAKGADMKSLDLWPTGKQGGGKSAVHIQPSHVVNLAIALAVADPITIGPGRVLAFRDLVLQPPEGTSAFGDMFDGLIDLFARPEGRKARLTMHRYGAGVLLYPTQRPLAVFEHHHDDKQTFYLNFAARPEDPLTPALHMRVRVMGITRIGSININIIEMMSDLWADSRSKVPAFAEMPPLFPVNPFDRESL